MHKSSLMGYLICNNFYCISLTGCIKSIVSASLFEIWFYQNRSKVQLIFYNQFMYFGWRITKRFQFYMPWNLNFVWLFLFRRIYCYPKWQTINKSKGILTKLSKSWFDKNLLKLSSFETKLKFEILFKGNLQRLHSQNQNVTVSLFLAPTKWFYSKLT